MNIKEIEQRSGLTRANIRYYEQEGLLAPARRENQYRDYSEEDLQALLRIVLLRSLGFSLEEIRRLQNGELELAAALRERSEALEREGQRLLAARSVCDEMAKNVTSYSALQPESYLKELTPDVAAKRQDRAEPHPWRRLFARAIDLTLAALPVTFVQYVLLHHNVSQISTWESILCDLLAWGVLLFLEPLLLARFGTTVGKWCMGITVTRSDGTRLSYGDALSRTAFVWTEGAGLGLPLVGWVCEYRSYRRYMDGVELSWEYDSVEHFDERGTAKMVGLCALAQAACYVLTFGMALAPLLPPCRGELSVADFAENVNYYRTYFGYDGRWRLDENGAWVEQSDPTVFYMDHTPPTAFVYTAEDGRLRTVTWHYAAEGQMLTPNVYDVFLAYLSLAAAQRETNLFNISKLAASSAGEDWQADTPCRLSWKGTEMQYQAEIDGEYFCADNCIFSVGNSQTITVALDFEASVDP